MAKSRGAAAAGGFARQSISKSSKCIEGLQGFLAKTGKALEETGKPWNLKKGDGRHPGVQRQHQSEGKNHKNLEEPRSRKNANPISYFNALAPVLRCLLWAKDRHPIAGCFRPWSSAPWDASGKGGTKKFSGLDGSTLHRMQMFCTKPRDKIFAHKHASHGITTFFEHIYNIYKSLGTYSRNRPRCGTIQLDFQLSGAKL